MSRWPERRPIPHVAFPALAVPGARRVDPHRLLAAVAIPFAALVTLPCFAPD